MQRKCIGVLIFFLGFFLNAMPQSGVVKGYVTHSGNGLPSVSLVLLHSGMGNATDSNGYYEIKHVPYGRYQLQISCIGYEVSKKNVSVNSAVPIVLNIELNERTDYMDQVIVTGVSRATVIKKNPVPVVVVTKAQMEMNVNNNIIDAILKNVPGMTAVTTGPNISKPFIRGLGYNRVLTMYDGMRQEGQQWGDEHGIEIDQYGIERAEVVKGPASLTYGSDALAGVINLIPHIPDASDGKLKGDALLDIHSNNGMIGHSVGLAYTKKDWKYLLRATVKAAHDYRNKIDGYVYNTAFREYNLSGMIGIDKSWGYAHLNATLYDNLQEIPDGSRDSLSRAFTYQVNEIDADDIKHRPVVHQNEFTSYAITPLHQHIQHSRIYVHNKIKLKRSDLNFLLGFQQSIRREFDHPTDPSQAGLFVVLNTINYDLKYNLPELKGIETTIGVNGMYQVNVSKNATDFPIPDYHQFDAGSYLFIKKEINKVNISGGIRFDTRHVEWNDFFVRRYIPTGFDKHVFSPDTISSVLQFPAFKHNYYGLSGSIGVAYQVSERLTLKANIARGYRSPNITEIGSNGLDPGAHIVYLGNRDFNPEFSLQEDIGCLAYLKNADITIDLFNNNIQNYIYQAKLYDSNGQPVVIVAGNTTYQYRQSRAQLYGMEITANLHPEHIAWVQFNNSLSVMKGLNKNEVLIKEYGDSAKYLPFIPPLHSKSELKLLFHPGKGIISNYFFSIDMEYYAAQNHYYAVDNTETKTGGYSLLNFESGVTITGKKTQRSYKLFLQVNNIFNTAYQSNLNRLKYFEYYTESPNGHLGIYNMGRNICMKIIMPF